MTFVVTAYWDARPGEEHRVAEFLELVTPMTRAENGCLMFRAYRCLDNPAGFFLHEQYVDGDAFEQHRASEHFQRYILGEVVPRLDARHVSTQSIPRLDEAAGSRMKVDSAPQVPAPSIPA